MRDLPTNSYPRASTPLSMLRHLVTGAIERGEAVAITEQPAPHVYAGKKLVDKRISRAVARGKAKAARPKRPTAAQLVRKFKQMARADWNPNNLPL